MVHFRNGRLHEWPGALRSVPQMSSTTSLKKHGPRVLSHFFALGHICHVVGEISATSAEVTANGGVR